MNEDAGSMVYGASGDFAKMSGEGLLATEKG